MVGLFTSSVSIFILFIGFASESYIKISTIKRRESINEIISNCIIISLSIFLFFFTLLFFFKENLEKIFGVHQHFVFVTLVVSFNHLIQSFLLGYYQANDEASKYVKLSIFSLILNICLSIFLVVLIYGTYHGRVYAIAATSFIMCAMSIFFLAKENLIRVKFKKSVTYDILLFTLPLFPHTCLLYTSPSPRDS